jgi:cytochrome c-type biogenesis protein CcmH
MIWLIFAGLALATIAILVLPLLRAKAAPLSRAEYDLTVYRDQLAEIEVELERGTLSADQAVAARTEIQRRILALGGATKPDAAQAARSWKLATVLALVVPLLAFGLYVFLGAPMLPDQPYAARADKIKEMQDQGEMIRNMVASLTAKLEKNPNDGKGWGMLGRSLRVLGQKDQAINAYRKAIALLPADTTARMELAGLLLEDIPQGAVLPPEFVGLMREVLAVDPDNMDALYFAGIGALQMGDTRRARELWTKVMVQLPEGEDKSEMKKQIDGLK